MASREMKTVSVRIGGVEHRIRGEAPGEYIEYLAQQVDKEMSRVSKSHPNITKTRAAILVALNMADELEKLKNEYQELVELMDEAQ